MGERLYTGIAAINVDTKGRMAVPSRYREDLQEQCQGRLVLTVDVERCLLMYPQSEWQEVERKLVALPTSDPWARRLQRLLLGHASEVELDSHGRILLPALLREYAGLDKRVMLVGQGKRFELWDEETWNTKRDIWVKEAAEEHLSPSAGTGPFSY